jgi:hypothetical protein
MSYWRIMRAIRIWLGIQCPTCHADLRIVATCGFSDCPLSSWAARLYARGWSDAMDAKIKSRPQSNTPEKLP